MNKSGVHHVAIGVKNFDLMQSFYRDVLGISKVFVEFPEIEHKPLSELVRMPHVVFKGVMLFHPAGGMIVELVKMTNPVPRPVRNDFRYGDIGLNKIIIYVNELEHFYIEYKDRINFCSKPKMAKVPGLGDYHFVYCKDPEGNLIEFIANSNVKTQTGYGGVYGAGIGVTDLERSMSFYQSKMAFDQVIIKPHEKFSGHVDEITGYKNTKVRSCMLSSSQGGGVIELFEAIKPRGRSIPFSTIWGDLGYLQVCLNGNDIIEIADYCRREGIEVIAGPNTADDDLAPSLVYLRDPDGLMLEYICFRQ
jgi:catechol 2,3-dioxygenase-like lactoylglutathione lyase family enzyme